LRINSSSSTESTSDPLLGDVATPSIVAGGSVSTHITVNVGSATGTRYIWVFADNFSAISQSDVVNDIQHSPPFTVTSGQTNSVLLGLDVSHYQDDAGPIDWAAVRAAGKAFVFIKASEGTDIPDGCNHNIQGCPVSDHSVENIQGATAAGLLVSPYHLADVADSSTNNATAEAQYFLSRAGAYATSGYLPPALDIESMYGLTGAQLSGWVRAWLQYVQQQKPGVIPIIYTTRCVLLSLDTDLLSYPLWIADYDYDPGATPCYQGVCSSQPVCWQNWKFKQYQAGDLGGFCPGITGGVDLDSFNGSQAALNCLTIGGGGCVAAPTIGTPQRTGSTFTLSLGSGASSERFHQKWPKTRVSVEIVCSS
jgi:lysozyme